MQDTRVFRVSFHIRGKHYELITVALDISENPESLGLPAEAEVMRIEDFGLRSDMTDAEFEQLRQEAAEWNEWSGRL